jgi:RHS repeat-associated protein
MVFASSESSPSSGLRYYGFRYYNVFLGRWPSRDPIGEYGGINLFGFVENNSPNEQDHLGLSNNECKLVTAQMKSIVDSDESDFNSLNEQLNELAGVSKTTDKARRKLEEELEKLAKKVTSKGSGKGGPKPKTAAELARKIVTRAVEDAGKATKSKAEKFMENYESSLEDALDSMVPRSRFYMEVTVCCNGQNFTGNLGKDLAFILLGIIFSEFEPQ